MRVNRWRQLEIIDFTQGTNGSFSGGGIVGKSFSNLNTGTLSSNLIVNGSGIVQTVSPGVKSFADVTYDAYYDTLPMQQWAGGPYRLKPPSAGLRAMMNFSLASANENYEFIKFGWMISQFTYADIGAYGLITYGFNGDVGGPGLKAQSNFFGGQGNAAAATSFGPLTANITPDVLVAEMYSPFIVRVGYGSMVGSAWPKSSAITWLEQGSLVSLPARNNLYANSGQLIEEVALAGTNWTGRPVVLFSAQPTLSASSFTVTRKAYRLETLVQ